MCIVPELEQAESRAVHHKKTTFTEENVSDNSSFKSRNNTKNFNNQNSENLKEQFQLEIKYTEIQKEKKILQKTISNWHLRCRMIFVKSESSGYLKFLLILVSTPGTTGTSLWCCFLNKGVSLA